MNAMKEERRKRGWSQVTLSLKTGGIAPSDLSAIENGKKIPHPGWRRRIARALKVDEATLFGSEKP
jgi:ribosome-binding protein aMBF1 (putative translation factor)